MVGQLDSGLLRRGGEPEVVCPDGVAAGDPALAAVWSPVFSEPRTARNGAVNRGLAVRNAPGRTTALFDPSV